MDYQDYYATLGVPKTATEKEIRTAYRQLARQHHPDVNPGNKDAEERFKRINEAYEVLSDAEKRKLYDELGPRWREYEQWQRAGGTGPPPGQRGPADWSEFAGAGARGGPYSYRTVNEEDLRDLFGDESPFSDFFHQTFTGGRAGRGSAGGPRPRAPRQRPGMDLEHPIEVALAEAYRGATRLLNIQQPDGTAKRLEVKIPPGVETGSRVRIAGQGEPGLNGGPNGDLYLVVDVLPDPRFRRDGNDLRVPVTVPLTVPLLGGEAKVPTPDGRTLTLTVPAGTQDGQTFRLRGQGVPFLNDPNRKGDLYAEVHVELPERLNPRQRELVEELARTLGTAPAGTA